MHCSINHTIASLASNDKLNTQITFEGVLLRSRNDFSPSTYNYNWYPFTTSVIIPIIGISVVFIELMFYALGLFNRGFIFKLFFSISDIINDIEKIRVSRNHSFSLSKSPMITHFAMLKKWSLFIRVNCEFPQKKIGEFQLLKTFIFWLFFGLFYTNELERPFRHFKELFHMLTLVLFTHL